MVQLSKYFLLLILTGISLSAYAQCYTNQGGATSQDINIPVSNIIVQRDAPVGESLVTVETAGSSIALSCDSEKGGGYYGELMLFTTPSNITDVYNTNIEGVGVRAAYETFMFESPAAFVEFDGAGALWFHGIGLTFIKTGKITPGVISAGLFSRIYGGGDMETALAYHLPAVTVTQLACSINTPKLTFPIGNVPASEFGNSIGFIPAESNTQNLGLNCDVDANINVELSGTQNPDVSDTSVLALNGQGTAGVASGLGVQLLYNGEPLENNKNIVMKKSEGGQEMLPITARYYQTKTAVMPGDASTSATLILTYQ